MLGSEKDYPPKCAKNFMYFFSHPLKNSSLILFSHSSIT